MIVQIMGKRWELQFVSASEIKAKHGDCDRPDQKNKMIRVVKNRNSRVELDSIIHECLHAADWYKDEEWIEEVARDIARILYKLGWRKDATESH